MNSHHSEVIYVPPSSPFPPPVVAGIGRHVSQLCMASRLSEKGSSLIKENLDVMRQK